MMKDLLNKAAEAEVTQHLPLAQNIIDDAAYGPQVVAFLLQTYRRAQLDHHRPALRRTEGRDVLGREAGERVFGSSHASTIVPGRVASGRGRGAKGRSRTGRPVSVSIVSASSLLNEPVLSAPEPSVEAEESAVADRRRRRRRRGRGKAVATDQGPSVACGTGPGFAIVDAKDILCDTSASLAAPALAPVPLTPVAEKERGPMHLSANKQPVSQVAAGSEADKSVREHSVVRLDDGLTRMRVNIGFDDGFKGHGAVAKKVAALAGLGEGIVLEEEARRAYAVLKASSPVADLVRARVDGTQLGKKVITVQLAH